MLHGVILALFSKVFYAATNILDAHIIGNLFNRLPTVIFYNGITNFIALPVILYFGTPDFASLSIDMIILMILVAFIDVLYQFPYYKSLQKLDTSIVTAMFSLGNITVPVLAYFIVSEKLETSQYIGFFVVIITNLALSINFSSINKLKNMINSAFWLMLMVSILLAFQGVIDKRILNETTWVTLAFSSTILTSLISFSMILFPSYRRDIIQSKPIFKKHFKTFLTMEICNQAGALTYLAALSFIPVVVMKSISSTQPIFVLLIGIILYNIYGNKFKESITKQDMTKKIICFIIITIGVVITTIS